MASFLHVGDRTFTLLVMSNMFLINFSFVKTALILAISIFLINLWLSSKGYLFTEESIAAVARKHAAQFKEKVDGRACLGAAIVIDCNYDGIVL